MYSGACYIILCTFCSFGWLWVFCFVLLCFQFMKQSTNPLSTYLCSTKAHHRGKKGIQTGKSTGETATWAETTKLVENTQTTCFKQKSCLQKNNRNEWKTTLHTAMWPHKQLAEKSCRSRSTPTLPGICYVNVSRFLTSSGPQFPCIQWG